MDIVVIQLCIPSSSTAKSGRKTENWISNYLSFLKHFKQGFIVDVLVHNAVICIRSLCDVSSLRYVFPHSFCHAVGNHCYFSKGE